MAKIDDLEVTNILDPDLKHKSLTLTEEDIDFELDEALSDVVTEKTRAKTGSSAKTTPPAAKMADKKVTSDDDWGLDDLNIESEPLDSAASDLLDLDDLDIEAEAADMGDDDILDLDGLEVPDGPDKLLVTAPTSKVAVENLGLDENEIDFELTEESGPVDAQAEPFGKEEGDFEFDLDEVVQADEPVTVPAGPLPPAPDEVEDDVEFELEEVVASAELPTPHADQPLEEKMPALTMDVEEFLGPPPPVAAAVTEMTAATVPVLAKEITSATVSTPGPAQPPELGAAPLNTTVLDMDRLEVLIGEAVRETVSKVLEKMLPALVDEILSRELEKLRRELEES